MSQLQKKRTWDSFKKDRLEKLSESREITVCLAKRRFDEFCTAEYNLNTDQFIDHIKNLDEKNQDDELFSTLQGWIDWLSDEKNIQIGSIRGQLSGLNKYFRYRKLKIDKDDMKDEIDYPNEIKEEKYAISLDEVHRVIHSLPIKYQGFCIGLVSGGMRPVELMGTQKKHYTLIDGRYKLEIPYYLTKKKISRTVFLSSEFTNFAKPVLDKINDDDFVWTTHTQIPKKTHDRYSHIIKKERRFSRTVLKFCRGSHLSLIDVLVRRLKSLGLDMRYETTGNHKINLYCFRGFFFTKALKIHNEDTAHAMIGHGAYIQEYQRRTDDEKLELFLIMESELLVFDLSKKNNLIKELKADKLRVDKLEQEIIELKERNQREVEEKNIMAENYRNDTSIPVTDDDLKEWSLSIPKLRKIINSEIMKNSKKDFENSN